MYGNSGKVKLITTDKTNEDIAATNVDRVVALFQNKATKNITNIPGVNKPVKFCIYWNIESKLPKSGFATITATNKERTTVFLPMLINLDSETWFLENFLYISIVKIVLILFVIDANEETIAAIKAAKVNPNKPLGKSDIIVG